MASEKVSDTDEALATVLPSGWVPVGRYPRHAAAQEAGLVILAMGHPYWLLPGEAGYVLCVEAPALAAVEAELAAVADLRKCTGRPQPVPLHDFAPGWVSFLIYSVLLIVIFVLQAHYGLVEAGRVDAVAICAGGELWRAITALTLHADVLHLVSNLVAGAGFAFFVARFFGAAAGWLLILVAGTLGNLLNAVVHYPQAHSSIGASTAVFGALGLLTGVGLRHALVGPSEGWTLPRWLLPAFGGLTLLGLLGVGEGPVDVAAHISGFLCGGLLGFLAALRQGFFQGIERWSLGLGSATLLAVGMAWSVALVA